MSTEREAQEKARQNLLKEAEKEELLELSEVSLLIHDYDYLFSDFDPRPYQHRSISDDFLLAAQKATMNHHPEDLIELKFLIPKEQRNEETELAIKKRLHEHFKKHFQFLSDEINTIKKKGALLAVAGFCLMIIAAYLYTIAQNSFWMHMLIIIFEPAGWFTTWYGLDQIFYIAAEKKENYSFYKKMSRCHISFNQF